MIYLKNRSLCKLLKKITSYEIWTGRALDFSDLHFFEIICFAKKKKTRKFDDRAIKKRFLGYEASNQYRIWNVEKRSVIRTAHVEFDEITSLSEIRGDSDDFEYATLDFSRLSEEEETASETIEAITFDEVDEVGEMVGDENVEIDESDEESVSLGSDDPLTENVLVGGLENLKINQQFEQSEQSAPSPQPISASGRSFRNILRSDYFKLNDS